MNVAPSRLLSERVRSLERIVEQNGILIQALRDQLEAACRAEQILRRAGGSPLPMSIRVADPPEGRRVPRPRRPHPHLHLVKIAIIAVLGLAAMWGSAQYHPFAPVRHHTVSVEDRRARRMDAREDHSRA